jgi:hypothetical protein
LKAVITPNITALSEAEIEFDARFSDSISGFDYCLVLKARFGKSGIEKAAKTGRSFAIK